MAEKVSYPQIPSTVWWGVRGILQRSPGATIDERVLGVQLGVQEAAARQYLAELKRVGILTDENKATPLAQRWRLDDSYLEAVDELIAAAYPESLVHVAPPGEADRQKIVSWFLREGLGNGAAGNKAATYLLISSRTPNESPSRSPNGRSKDEPKSTPTKASAPPPSPRAAATTGKSRIERVSAPSASRTDAIPLNVNVQIHIGADAGAEQIETIFSAMRRYLYDEEAR